MIDVRADGADLSRAAAELVARVAREACAERGRCSIALAGGSTPKATYELLARSPFAETLPWDKLLVFWGDERFVPPDHPDSNERMAREALLSHVPIPAENIYGTPTMLGDPRAAAAAYDHTVRQVLGDQPRFDLVLLGMGDDGHTASLFPHTAALDATAEAVVANHVEKLGAWRITLTAPAINAAAHVAFLVAGGSKAPVLREVLEGPPDPRRLPSQLIRPSPGQLLWLVDRAAAADLKELKVQGSTFNV